MARATKQSSVPGQSPVAESHRMASSRSHRRDRTPSHRQAAYPPQIRKDGTKEFICFYRRDPGSLGQRRSLSYCDSLSAQYELRLFPAARAFNARA